MIKIKLPKYTTIEIMEFPLQPNYSGDPFAEYSEYNAAIAKREQDISAYRDAKISKPYQFLDYPTRANIALDNNAPKDYFHISRRYYSRDYTQRILISGNEESDVIFAFFQTSINSTCEQKTIK